jgi:hypothetical protein
MNGDVPSGYCCAAARRLPRCLSRAQPMPPTFSPRPTWQSYRRAESCPRSLARSAAIRTSRALLPRCGFDAIFHGKFFSFSILQNLNFHFWKVSKFRFSRISKSYFQEFWKFRNDCAAIVARTKNVERTKIFSPSLASNFQHVVRYTELGRTGSRISGGSRYGNKPA